MASKDFDISLTRFEKNGKKKQAERRKAEHYTILDKHKDKEPLTKKRMTSKREVLLSNGPSEWHFGWPMFNGGETNAKIKWKCI